MNTSTEHIPQCNQSEPLADASGSIVDLMNENGVGLVRPMAHCDIYFHYIAKLTSLYGAFNC